MSELNQSENEAWQDIVENYKPQRRSVRKAAAATGAAALLMGLGACEMNNTHDVSSSQVTASPNSGCTQVPNMPLPDAVAKDFLGSNAADGWTALQSDLRKTAQMPNGELGSINVEVMYAKGDGSAAYVDYQHLQNAANALSKAQDGVSNVLEVHGPTEDASQRKAVAFELEDTSICQ